MAGASCTGPLSSSSTVGRLDEQSDAIRKELADIKRLCFPWPQVLALWSLHQRVSPDVYPSYTIECRSDRLQFARHPCVFIGRLVLVPPQDDNEEGRNDESKVVTLFRTVTCPKENVARSIVAWSAIRMLAPRYATALQQEQAGEGIHRAVISCNPVNTRNAVFDFTGHSFMLQAMELLTAFAAERYELLRTADPAAVAEAFVVGGGETGQAQHLPGAALNSSFSRVMELKHVYASQPTERLLFMWSVSTVAAAGAAADDAASNHSGSYHRQRHRSPSRNSRHSRHSHGRSYDKLPLSSSSTSRKRERRPESCEEGIQYVFRLTQRRKTSSTSSSSRSHRHYHHHRDQRTSSSGYNDGSRARSSHQPAEASSTIPSPVVVLSYTGEVGEPLTHVIYRGLVMAARAMSSELTMMRMLWGEYVTFLRPPYMTTSVSFSLLYLQTFFGLHNTGEPLQSDGKADDVAVCTFEEVNEVGQGWKCTVNLDPQRCAGYDTTASSSSGGGCAGTAEDPFLQLVPLTVPISGVSKTRCQTVASEKAGERTLGFVKEHLETQPLSESDVQNDSLGKMLATFNLQKHSTKVHHSLRTLNPPTPTVDVGDWFTASKNAEGRYVVVEAKGQQLRARTTGSPCSGSSVDRKEPPTTAAAIAAPTINPLGSSTPPAPSAPPTSRAPPAPSALPTSRAPPAPSALPTSSTPPAPSALPTSRAPPVVPAVLHENQAALPERFLWHMDPHLGQSTRAAILAMSASWAPRYSLYFSYCSGQTAGAATTTMTVAIHRTAQHYSGSSSSTTSVVEEERSNMMATAAIMCRGTGLSIEEAAQRVLAKLLVMVASYRRRVAHRMPRGST